MTQEQRLTEMENQLELVLENQEKTDKKLDEVLSIFKGNEMTGEPGWAKRLIAVEAAIVKFNEDRTKNGVYIKIISWLAGIIIALIMAYMFNQAYERPQQPAQQSNQPK